VRRGSGCLSAASRTDEVRQELTNRDISVAKFAFDNVHYVAVKCLFSQ